MLCLENKPKTSLLSSIFQMTPWLTTTLGKFFYGPSYGMTDTELKQYERDIAQGRRIEFLKKDKERDFQAAKYMAVMHPHWYWHNYVEKFEKGREERKRAVLLFALANKEMFGNHYGAHPGLFKNALDKEFEDMGYRLNGKSIIKMFMEGKRSGRES